jgi:hypothetical protein
LNRNNPKDGYFVCASRRYAHMMLESGLVCNGFGKLTGGRQVVRGQLHLSVP